MAVKIALDSFLAVARRSNLVTKDQLATLQESYQREGLEPDSSRRFAEYLVRQKALTGWQAEKLLQGKHKGFFLGKYRLLALLGKGGMSSVYLAEHVLMRRRCAIKVLPTRRVHDASYLARFHREAQAVAALDHPNIVRAYDVDHEVDGDMEIHFLVMEFVDGKSLLEIVQSGGPLSPVRAAEYVRQAALGLAHAHKAGLVHRDVKPGNLLVDSAGVVKVLDLGLARFFEAKEDVSLTVQHDERVLGTADYLAPEQAVDSHGVTARADIYSLGCTLYFCLTGHPPFTQGTLAQRLMAHQTKEPPPVESRRTDLSPQLADIVRRMMMKRSEDRYNSAADVAQALQEWLAHQAGEDPSPPPKLAASRQPTPFPAAADETSIQKSPVTAPRPAARAPVALQSAPARATAPQRVAPGGPGAAVEPELGAFLWRLNVESTGDIPIYTPDGSDSAIVSTETRKKVLGDDQPQKQPEAKATADTMLRSQSAPAGRQSAVAPAVRASVAAPAVSPAGGLSARGQPVPAPVVPDTFREDSPPPERVKPGGAHSLESALAEPIGVGGSSVIRRRSNSKQTLTAYVIAAAVFAVVALTIFVATRGDGTDQAAPPGRSNPDSGGDTTTTTQHAPVEPPQRLGPVLTVGPTGEFRNISSALAYIKGHADELPDGETWRVTVAGGRTYEERIVAGGPAFGLPHGVRIESTGPSPAVLKATSAAPVIELSGTEHLTLSGLTIDAGGGDVAIALEGFLIGTRLEDLTIQGYVRAGVSSNEAVANAASPARLERLQFRPASAESTGIRLGDVRHLVIDQCRLVGPMQVGIEFTSSTWNLGITVRRCVFHEQSAGIRFAARGPDVQDTAFVNNTFHRVRNGLRFDYLPAAGSSRLTIHHNLFVDVDPGPEVQVSNGFDPAAAAALLPPAAARNNWTQRAGGASEPGEIDVFAGDGRRGAETGAFVSPDPASPDFLKPASPAVRNELKTPAPNAEPYVGASAP